jgi:hypothetical protein
LKRSVLTDSLLIAILTALLIGPLFKLKYLERWDSIESTFISDARMLGDHLPHPGWQPLWYCGTRFDYVYPPALRYGPALLAKAARLTPARAYHFYTAFLYVFGIVAVYWMVLAGARSRLAALLSAAATALVSPSFLFLTRFRVDSGVWIPQRLHVLMTYGEGPHISAVSILPAALAASFLALRRWRPLWFAAASVLSAAVVAHNFYGATSLAIFFPIMVWSVWAGERDAKVWLRAAGIAALAYGLSAFWLTPSYVKITLLDLKWVAPPGNNWSSAATLVLAALLCLISLRFASRDREWTLFVAGSAIMLVFIFVFRTTGNTERFVPELDLVLILGFFEALRHVKNRKVTAALTLLFLSPAVIYLQHAWSPFPKAGSVESQYPFTITKWVHENLPGQRVLPIGEVRFWYDAWFDNAQTDGGSMQGMLNQHIPLATWQVEAADGVAPGLQWLEALGTDAVIVPDETSRDLYRTDFKNPRKFRGLLPVLYDDEHGTVIYRVPRVHPGIGRVVDGAAIAGAAVEKYAAAVETPDQPLTTVTWKGFDEIAVEAKTAAGQSVLLQETYDPGWHAYEDSREIPIRREPVMEFMLMDLPAGSHAIHMRFETPAENRAGQILLVLSVIVLGWLLSVRFRARAASAGLAPSASVPAPSRD